MIIGLMMDHKLLNVQYTIVVKYVKKSALNTAYSIFLRNTYEYVKFPVIKPAKNLK